MDHVDVLTMRHRHVHYAAVVLCFACPMVSAASLTNFEATAIKGPECVTDTSSYFYAEEETAPAVPANLGHFYMVVRHMGLQAVAAPARNDFAQLPLNYPDADLSGAPLTGLTVPEPRANWQRARQPFSTADNSSAFQIHCYDVGSFINTWAFPYQVVVGGGHHSVYAYDFDEPLPPAFDDDPSTDLVMQVSLEVPGVALWPSPDSAPLPVGQASLFAYFRDRTTGKLFASVLLLFDTRLGAGWAYPSNAAHDMGTPFVSMALNDSARYAVLSPVSASATGIPWTGLRFFRGHITQDTFRTMLRDIDAYCADHRDAAYCDSTMPNGDAFSEDVRNYDVEEFGFLHEVFRTPDSNISMGLHFFGVGLFHFRDAAPSTIH